MLPAMLIVTWELWFRLAKYRIEHDLNIAFPDCAEATYCSTTMTERLVNTHTAENNEKFVVSSGI